jgi:hypothetical protein
MISETKRKVLDTFAEGLKHYKLMNFKEAGNAFAAALKLDPDDGPSKVFYARCKHYIKNPPPDEWDGVFTMTTK